MGFKDIVRGALTFLHLDITKNLQYDRLTHKIFKMVIRENSNCIDIGCHKGEMLELMINLAPKGTHFAFEPIPQMFSDLKGKYGDKANIFPFAVADTSGSTTFQHVTNAPAYSGINKREYAVSDPGIRQIEVEVRTLDEVISADTRIDLIKIDVEGGEFGVFRGAVNTIKENKPVIVFECGLGASEFYGTVPAELYEFISDCGLKISTLKAFANKGQHLSAAEFVSIFNNGSEYYFVAHP